MTYTKFRHELGFYQARPTPSQETLEKHYRDAYFQGAAKFYLPEYNEDERTFFRNRGVVAEHILKASGGVSSGKMIDVGCGEGFFAAYFAERGWKVEAADFSSHAIQKHNPQLLDHFTQGNIYEILDRKIEEGLQYDLINLSNVCEHVVDPLGLLDRLRRIMHPRSMLQIVVPNDFSEFQKMIVEKGLTGETWFAPPEHLNYFTFSTFKAVLADRGFSTPRVLAGFPIEIFLFNEHSNYWKDRSKGRQAHLTRIHVDNFLVRQGLETYVNLMSAAADSNYGRMIYAYAFLK